MNSSPELFEKTSDQPLHKQVREHLRRHCLQAAPDAPLPALRQLSETLGVNHITISRALRDLESEGLVRVVAGKGTFVSKAETVHRTIEMLTLCTHIGGLLETSLNTFKGMQDRLPDGFHLSVQTFSQPPVPSAEVFLQSAKARNLAALAVFDFEYLHYPDSFLEAQFVHELAAEMPVVLVGKEHSLLKLDCIFCDPAPQMKTFLEERHGAGKRRFAYLGANDGQPHLNHRLSEFEHFLLARGLPWQRPAKGTDAPTEIERILEAKPQVVVVSEPWGAHHLVIEAQQRGLKLGRDLQILCFAGSMQHVRAIAPYVSVILLEEEEVGRCVIKRIHSRLEGSDKPPPIIRRIPGKLVRQGESAPTAK